MELLLCVISRRTNLLVALLVDPLAHRSCPAVLAMHTIDLIAMSASLVVRHAQNILNNLFVGGQGCPTAPSPRRRSLPNHLSCGQLTVFAEPPPAQLVHGVCTTKLPSDSAYCHKLGFLQRLNPKPVHNGVLVVQEHTRSCERISTHPCMMALAPTTKLSALSASTNPTSADPMKAHFWKCCVLGVAA